MDQAPAAAVPAAQEPKKPITWGPLASIVVTVAIYFASQLIGSLLLIGVAKLRGWDNAQITHWVQQVFPQFLYIFLVEGLSLAILWRFLRSRRAKASQIGLVKPKTTDLGYVFIGLIIYFPLLIAVMAAIGLWFPQVNLHQPQQVGFTSAHGLSLILVYISLAILPPITEEIMVRGFLFSGLRSKLPKVAAMVLASLIFAAPHLQAGQGAPLLWSAAADTFILSMVLIYLRIKTGSLWAPIGVHVVKNSIAFAALFIFVR